MFLRILVGLIVTVVIGQTTIGLADDPPPGNIQLLPGYTHKALQGIDSQPGVIEKEGGLKIHYDIGAVIPPGQPRFGGSFSDQPKAIPKNRREWYKEQIIAGQPVHIAYTKQHVLMAAFPKGGINFSVKAETNEEITEALLMILSYPKPVAKANSVKSPSPKDAATD
ncbi:MAG: hypothetical protein KDA84_02570 [Planctomycetaceae bacterium]|nr:hypothetical protein [Planctomycetaceae bacterium]